MQVELSEKLCLEQLHFLKPTPLDSIPEAVNLDSLELEASRTGHYTIKREGRYLHSRYNPLDEAKRQLAEIPLKNSEQLALFFGAGLGYSIQSFLERHHNPCIWFEPDPEILITALHLHDFRTELSSGRLRIFLGHPSDDELTELLEGRSNRQIEFVLHRASFAINPGYEKIRLFCENFLNRQAVNLATITRFDRLWAKNITANYVHLTEARPVSLLFNRWKGCRALVCGAGPSLTDSLPEIRRLRNSSVVIAVDTALQVLTGAGIDPHLIMSVDPQAVNRKYIEGYQGDGYFVVDPTTCYLSLRMLPADRLFYTASHFPLAQLLYDHLNGEPGDIAFGGSVSTNAYDLALKVGAHEILLFGQDLSFTGGLAHVRGAVLEESLNYIESRTFRRELHNYRQLSALPVRTLPAIGGGEVKTNDKMVIFHRWFTNRIPADLEKGISIQNCTPQGAHLTGCLHKPPPASAGENNFSGPLDLSELSYDNFNRADFYAALQALIGDLVRFGELLSRGRALADEIIEVFRNNPDDERYPGLLTQIDAIDEKTKKELELSRILGAAMQRVILQITADYESALTPEEEGDPNLKVARQSQLLYSGLLEACQTHIRWLSRTLEIGKNS